MAREMGIPVIYDVRGATSLLKSGDQVTVDGSRGEVTVHTRGG